MALLLLANALAVASLHLPGTADVVRFLRWMQRVEAHGVVEGYAAFRDVPYPPLTAVLLAGVNALSDATGLAPQQALKVSLLVALLLSTAIVWAWTRELLIAALFELSLVLCSTALGYLDVYFMPPLLLALWALQRDRLAWASALFTLSCLIKWQPAIVAPFLLIFVFAPGKGAGRPPPLRAAASVALPMLALCGAVLWIFGSTVIDNFLYSTRHPFLSGNALNLGWIATHLIRWLWPEWQRGLDQGFCYFILTRDPRLLLPFKLLAAVVYLAVCVLQWRRTRSFAHLLLFALLGYLTYGLVSSGVHENHLIVTGILAVLLYAFDRRWLRTMLYWTCAANLNLLLFYGVSGADVGHERVVGGLDVALIGAVLNMIALVVLFVRARRVE